MYISKWKLEWKIRVPEQPRETRLSGKKMKYNGKYEKKIIKLILTCSNDS